MIILKGPSCLSKAWNSRQFFLGKGECRLHPRTRWRQKFFSLQAFILGEKNITSRDLQPWKITLPETNIFALKMDGWKTRGYVSFREGSILNEKNGGGWFR